MFKYGCSAGVGEEWEDYPDIGTYTPIFTRFKIVFTTTDVEIVYENQTTSEGDPFDVCFENMYKYKQGSSKSDPLSIIVAFLSACFDLFVGLIFDGDWQYTSYTTLLNKRETFTVNCYESTYGYLAGLDGDIRYRGDVPDGTDYINVTIEVEITGYFEVDFEPADGTVYSDAISRDDEFIVQFTS